MNRQAILERVKIKLDEYTPVDGGVEHPLDGYLNPLLDEAANEIILKAPVSKLYPEQLKDTQITTIVSKMVSGMDGFVSSVTETSHGIQKETVFGTSISHVGTPGDEGTETTTVITEAVDRELKLSVNGTELIRSAYDPLLSSDVGIIEVSTVEAPRIIGVKVSDWVREVTEFEDLGSPKEIMQSNPFVRGTRSRPVVSISKDGDRHVIKCYTTTYENPKVSIRAIKAQKAEELHDDLITPLVLLTAAKTAQATEQYDLFKTLYELYVNSLL